MKQKTSNRQNTDLAIFYLQIITKSTAIMHPQTVRRQILKIVAPRLQTATVWVIKDTVMICR